jgi:hypothetical protein
MAESSSNSELARFTSEIAVALVKAMDARPARRSEGPEDNLAITVGIMINPDRPEVIALSEENPARSRSSVTPLPRADLERMSSRSGISRESIGRLNDEVGSDVPQALRLLKSLSLDPDTWDALFELDDERRQSLREVDPESLREFKKVVQKLELLRDELGSINFVINSRRSREGQRPRNPWYVPDKLELEFEVGSDHEGTHTSGAATLVFEFD